MMRNGSRTSDPDIPAPQNIDELKARWTNGETFSFYFFYGHEQKGDAIDASCLSQWFSREFVIDGIRYPTAEHWMMAEKARAFQDFETLGRILASCSPKEAKMLGRLVRNFDKDVWDKLRFGIVVTGNEAKFTQNVDLKDFLLSTATTPEEQYGLVAESLTPYSIGDEKEADPNDTIAIPFSRRNSSCKPILVEAAGRDCIWGIGLSKNNPKSNNPLTWRGLNLLGFALTSVRDRIK